LASPPLSQVHGEVRHPNYRPYQVHSQPVFNLKTQKSKRIKCDDKKPVAFGTRFNFSTTEIRNAQENGQKLSYFLNLSDRESELETLLVRNIFSQHKSKKKESQEKKS
jgi:hypothetical protein